MRLREKPSRPNAEPAAPEESSRPRAFRQLAAGSILRPLPGRLHPLLLDEGRLPAGRTRHHCPHDSLALAQVERVLAMIAQPIACLATAGPRQTLLAQLDLHDPLRR